MDKIKEIMNKIKEIMNKIKEILSKLTLKHAIGIGIGVIVVCFLAVMLFSSSSKGIDLIPKNTVAVGVISIGDMIDKADIKDLLKLDLDIVEDLKEKYEDASELVEEESDLAATIMENPYNIGIDVFQDVFVYGVIEDIKNGEVYVCLSGGVDDEDRLMEILEEIEDMMPKDLPYTGMSESSSESHFDISEEDGYNMLLVYDEYSYKDYNDNIQRSYTDISAFAWDDDKFLVITNPEARGDKKDLGNLEDEVERLFNLKSNEKLTSIDSFDDFYDNKTDLCAWASAEGMEQDLLDGIVDQIDYKTGFDLEVEDLQECSASLFYNFGDGNVSLKASLYASDGVQELIEEKTNISTSEFSFESTMTFDDSGDNTIHVILKSLLTIIDDVADLDDLDDIQDVERMFYKLRRMF
jgi:hypothetical protein